MPNRAFDAERADLLARFKAAFLFGPLHVAQHTGHDDEASKPRILLRYAALRSAITHPNNLQNRPSAVQRILPCSAEPWSCIESLHANGQ